MPKDTKSSGYNKAPACESRGFGHKKEGENFDTPSCILWEHLPNIPNESPKREVQDYLVHLFFVFDSTVIG